MLRRLSVSAAPLLVLAVLAFVAIFANNDNAAATTFNPTATYCVDNADTPATCDGSAAADAASDIYRKFGVDKPDSNLGGLIGLIPPDWTVAKDADVANGNVVAQLFPIATLSIAAGGCNTTVQPQFTLVDATVDMNNTIDYLSDPASLPNDTQIPLALDQDNNGVPDGADKYPLFLKNIPALVGLQPISRQFAWQDVSGATTVLNFLVFDKSTTFPTINNGSPGTLNSAVGYADVTVLNDPTAAPAASIIGDFCTPLSTEVKTFANPRANPCIGNPGACPDPEPAAGKNRRGLPGMTPIYGTPLGAPTAEVYRKNPAADGTYVFGTLMSSLRDADDDNIENTLDPCPFTANPTYDPRGAPPATGDTDGDGLPDEAGCDPDPTTKSLVAPAGFGLPCPTGGIYDEDQDCYGNRADNCPIVDNGQNKDKQLIGLDNQKDSDLDGIGDQCDTEPTTASGHNHGPAVDGSGCATAQVVVGAGGTPYAVCANLLSTGGPGGGGTPTPTLAPGATPRPTTAGGGGGGGGVGGPSVGIGSLSPTGASVPGWAVILSALGATGLVSGLGLMGARVLRRRQ